MRDIFWDVGIGWVTLYGYALSKLVPDSSGSVRFNFENSASLIRVNRFAFDPFRSEIYRSVIPSSASRWYRQSSSISGRAKIHHRLIAQ